MCFAETVAVSQPCLSHMSQWLSLSYPQLFEYWWSEWYFSVLSSPHFKQVYSIVPSSVSVATFVTLPLFHWCSQSQEHIINREIKIRRNAINLFISINNSSAHNNISVIKNNALTLANSSLLSVKYYVESVPFHNSGAIVLCLLVSDFGF